jgi:Holliday junction resolvase RusA-like endonuclease
VKGEQILETHIFEKAYPQDRPRINRHTGSIYSPLQRQGKVRAHFNDYCGEIVDIPFFLTAHFFFKEQRYYDSVDCDNLVKALADTLQAMDVISNDNLMVGHVGTKNPCGEDWIWLELRKAVQQNINLGDISRTPLIAS